MPAFTAPFVLTIGVFLLLMAGFRALERDRSPSAPRQSPWPDCAPQSRPARSRLPRLEAFGTRCHFGFGAESAHHPFAAILPSTILHESGGAHWTQLSHS